MWNLWEFRRTAGSNPLSRSLFVLVDLVACQNIVATAIWVNMKSLWTVHQKNCSCSKKRICEQVVWRQFKHHTKPTYTQIVFPTLYGRHTSAGQVMHPHHGICGVIWWLDKICHPLLQGSENAVILNFVMCFSLHKFRIMMIVGS